MKTILLSTAAALLVVSGASAQDGRIHLGGGALHIDADGANVSGAYVRGGYDFTQFFGAELEGHLGLKDDTVNLGGGVFADVGLNYGVAGFLKAQYPVSEQFSVFARGGYAWAEFDASAAGLSIKEDDDGFAYGVGAEWAFAGPNAIRFDYTRVNFSEDANVWTIGYVRRF
ncbi:porin family protein [Alkalicaulis satelles]|uniref:Porin family protein n=1 Tax=Alkalicaulis satelles TaxID=2609175 RepID=A0A5M6ZJ02_9PROT|nr:porin family protein [Alkalicaulis satelles]KAA5804793.1 porin family protein [Alkalicaulis satelles]